MAIALAHILDEIPAEGLSLDELTHAATRVLQELGITSGDARTSASIDVRTVRFYQTLGILPKPAYEGRCAVYSLTHVVRVVAAKQLQAEGHSLAQIQTALPAATDDALVQALTTAQRSTSSRSSPLPQRSEPAHCELNSAPSPACIPEFESPCVAELRTFTLTTGVTLILDPRIVANAEVLVTTLAALTLSHQSRNQSTPHGGK